MIHLRGSCAESAVFAPCSAFRCCARKRRSASITQLPPRVRPFTDKQIELVKHLRRPSGDRDRERAAVQRGAAESPSQQQTATSEVLQVISSSPGELEPVFEAMLENAVRICEAKFGTLFRYDGGAFRTGALFGAPAGWAELRQRGASSDPARKRFGRVARTKQVFHIDDVSGTAYIERDPTGVGLRLLGGRGPFLPCRCSRTTS